MEAGRKIVLQPVALRCEYRVDPIGVDTPQPRFSWQLQGNERGKYQEAYRVLVASSMEKLLMHIGDVWDSGLVVSGDTVHVIYGGNTLESRTRYFWKIQSFANLSEEGEWSEPALFETALLHVGDWKAQWISSEEHAGSPLLRKEFVLDREIRQARVYICGLGYFELLINGERIGRDVLVPAWTHYTHREAKDLLYPFDDRMRSRVLYLTYDVTGAVIQGVNAAGVMLGNGFYNQRERNMEGKLQYGEPRLLMQMEVEYTDGTRKYIVSDDSWDTAQGPIFFNNVYYGERYDARLEKPGWDKPSYRGEGWKKAVGMPPMEGLLAAQSCPPDRIQRFIQPILLKKEKDRCIYDVMENISGWTRICVKGPAGEAVTLRFAEELAGDGSLQYESAGGTGQIQQDTYILKGESVETYAPRFTWHAFRYVEILYSQQLVELKAVEGQVVHADVTDAGSFSCSHPLFNRLQEVYRRTQLNNLHGGVPSDCPHRERLGYTGDGQVTAEAAIYNLDMAAFYTKWIDDIADAQNSQTGFVPHTAPFYGGGGGPAWGCAYILIPWYMYRFYGDRRILEKHYSGMKHWMQYLTTRTDERGLITREEPGGWCLGDWCTPGEVQIPESLVNTFYYAYTAQILSCIAQVLELTGDAHAFTCLSRKASEALDATFLDREQGRYWEGRQGSDAFPLVLGHLPENIRCHVLQSIVSNMESNDGHFDTGIFGTRFILEVLAENGWEEAAYRLMNQTTYPSFGYMLEMGATTLWENWERERGSHNHPMFGSYSTWFFRYLAGLDTAGQEEGRRVFLFKPCILKDLHHVKASWKAMEGTAAIAWSKDENCLRLDIEVPTNTISRVYIPAALYSGQVFISESGIPVWDAGSPAKSLGRGIRSVEMQEGFCMISTGGGKYHFIVTGQVSE